MGETAIEWTDVTKNPIRARKKGSTATKGGYNSGVGHYCEKISPGCKRCYASDLQPRFGLPVFQEQRGENAPDVFLDIDVLLSVLRMKKGRRIFWCDMTDLFGSWVPFEWVCTILAVMAATPQHTHQILTKRTERALAFFAWLGALRGPSGEAHRTDPLMGCQIRAARYPELVKPLTEAHQRPTPAWPLPNVHFGVSVERQDERGRLDDLMRIPAAVRWASFEPLLGPVRAGTWIGGGAIVATPPGLDWGVVGLESGPKARPGDVRWIRHLVHQFRRAGKPIFVKQLGANTRDINDGRFAANAEDDGVPGAWPDCITGYPDRIEDNPNGFREDYQGAPVRVRLRHRKGGDPAEWPADLRVRMHVGEEWPT